MAEDTHLLERFNKDGLIDLADFKELIHCFQSLTFGKFSTVNLRSDYRRPDIEISHVIFKFAGNAIKFEPFFYEQPMGAFSVLLEDIVIEKEGANLTIYGFNPASDGNYEFIFFN